MAREATITQEQVNAAADSLIAAGQKVTNRAVRDAVGSGSMTTIVNLLQNWSSSRVCINTSVEGANDPDVSRAISSMLARRLAEAGAELNAKVADLQHGLSTVITENEQLTAEIKEQESELVRLRAQVQTQLGQIEQLTTEAEYAREQIVSERSARESAQIALAKAELRIESLPELQEQLKAALAEAKRAGEEAAELRGRMAGFELGSEKSQRQKVITSS